MCTNCGTDIALATLVVEHELIDWAISGKSLPPTISVEQLVPRLGEYLLRKGHVTQEQLQVALERQAATPSGKPAPRLGHTLIMLGAISRETLDRVIAEQILQLQAALVEANRTLEKRVADRTAELEATLLKLTELNQLKANFVANISHELRTPLAQIKGYNALLSDGSLGEMEDTQKEAVDVIMRATDRLERLITDLISYSTTAKGELTLRLQPVFPAEVLDKVRDRHAAKAEKQRLTFQIEVAPNLPPVTADEEKLLWVLLQLVDNALKFTPAGGQVTVSAEPHHTQVLFSVRDTGIGIPAHRLQEIFEPFHQLDGTAARRYGGTGLGLTLVRRIIEAHSAQLLVESAESQGSTFAFVLTRSISSAL